MEAPRRCRAPAPRPGGGRRAGGGAGGRGPARAAETGRSGSPPTPGPHLAIALDGSGAAVDGLGSNMGHVLGTGALSDVDAAPWRPRSRGRRCSTGSGSAPSAAPTAGSTRSATTRAPSGPTTPRSAAWGLAREGHTAGGQPRGQGAARLGGGLRLPLARALLRVRMMGRPSPYPASCRPQAWSAASAGVLVSVALGLRTDRAGGLVVSPPRPAPFGALTSRACGSRARSSGVGRRRRQRRGPRPAARRHRRGRLSRPAGRATRGAGWCRPGPRPGWPRA